MNPLNWAGPQFLRVYAVLFLLALVLGIALRRWLRASGGPPPSRRRPLDPYEVALLSGPKEVVHTALARLLHEGAIRMDGPNIETTGKHRDSSSPIERATYRAVSSQSMTLGELHSRAEPAIQELKEPLIAEGLLVAPHLGKLARWLPPLLCGLLLYLGLIKIGVGMWRDKPVGGLVLFSLINFITVLVLSQKVWRTRQGDEVLAGLRAEQAPLRMTARSAKSSEVMNSHDLALAVALFGLGAVTLTDFELLRRQIAPEVSSGGDSSSSSGCSSASSCSSSSSDSGGSSSCSSSSSCGSSGCGGCGGGGD
ncbi:TIGR04222 domain-containing membrane protein [Myxococcus landrumensis]|uniref:TIGR04222 domain-containing membrane protein n=1 Tax=Myxococcus landrumensis TaxID=2813577 RepID=A0ABX7N921_9BACT|nr:TIGR04222 domain-containing membrane protein [Myxococcus landrumus]QSQ15275.1 TIGR04222 domain-containing membrane protein [Myxococcus landrumus]